LECSDREHDERRGEQALRPLAGGDRREDDDE
jgi:hypothetical protein